MGTGIDEWLKLLAGQGGVALIFGFFLWLLFTRGLAAFEGVVAKFEAIQQRQQVKFDDTLDKVLKRSDARDAALLQELKIQSVEIKALNERLSRSPISGR